MGGGEGQKDNNFCVNERAWKGENSVTIGGGTRKIVTWGQS